MERKKIADLGVDFEDDALEPFVAREPQSVMEKLPESSNRFIPNWNIKRTDPFAYSVSSCKEAITHLSSLDEAENRTKSLEDMADECYLAQANSFSKSHYFIQKSYELCRAAGEDRKSIAALKASLEEKDKQFGASMKNLSLLRKDLELANCSVKVEKSKVAGLEASLSGCQKEASDLKAELAGRVEAWRRQYLKSKRFSDDMEPFIIKAGKDAWKAFFVLGEARSPGLGETLKGLHIGCHRPREKNLKPDGTCVSYVSIGKPWEVVEEGDEGSSVPFVEGRGQVVVADAEGKTLKGHPPNEDPLSSVKTVGQMLNEQELTMAIMPTEKEKLAASKKNGQSSVSQK